MAIHNEFTTNSFFTIICLTLGLMLFTTPKISIAECDVVREQSAEMLHNCSNEGTAVLFVSPYNREIMGRTVSIQMCYAYQHNALDTSGRGSSGLWLRKEKIKQTLSRIISKVFNFVESNIDTCDRNDFSCAMNLFNDGLSVTFAKVNTSEGVECTLSYFLEVSY